MAVSRFGSGVGWVSEEKHGERKRLADGGQGRGQSQGPFPSTSPGSLDSQARTLPPAGARPHRRQQALPSRTTEPWRVPQPQCFWAPALAPAVTSSWGHGASMRSRAMRAIHSFEKFHLSGYYLRNGEWTAPSIGARGGLITQKRAEPVGMEQPGFGIPGMVY